MTTTRENKSLKRNARDIARMPAPAPMSPPPPSQALPPDGHASSKKKKRKGKGRPSEEYVSIPFFEEDQREGGDQRFLDRPEDTIPRLELHPDLQPMQYSGREHLPSTTPISQSAAAAARLNATAAAQAELLATANDLYRRMDADPQGGIADDDEYWASLPAHIRNFVRLLCTRNECAGR